MLPAVPRPLVQRLSERYIAGPELKDAREAVRHINAQGKLATIDVLGEEITNEHEAAAIVRAYQDVFADIEHCGLDSNVSVKLTALGLNLDYEICRANLGVVVGRSVARKLRAYRHGGLVHHRRHAPAVSRAAGARP